MAVSAGFACGNRYFPERMSSAIFWLKSMRACAAALAFAPPLSAAPLTQPQWVARWFVIEMQMRACHVLGNPDVARWLALQQRQLAVEAEMVKFVPRTP